MNESNKVVTIDWSTVRQRLARALVSAEEAINPTPEQTRQILHLRARALARKPTPPEPPSAAIELVPFEIAGDRYGIETAYVREVRRLHEFTPVPVAPRGIIGIVPLRGELLTLFDFREFLHLRPAAAAKPSWIVVLGQEAAELGIVADVVSGVEQLPVKEIVSGRGSTDIPEAFLRGLDRQGMQILDGSALITSELPEER